MPAATKKTASHPSNGEMITKAISSLNDRSGSSVPAIIKFIQSNYKGTQQVQIKTEIKRLLDQGKLTRTKNSYKLKGNLKADDKKASKPASAHVTPAPAPSKPAPAASKPAPAASKPAPAASKPAPAATKAKAKPAAKGKAKAAPKRKQAKKVVKKPVVKSNRLANVPAPKPEVAKPAPVAAKQTRGGKNVAPKPVEVPKVEPVKVEPPKSPQPKATPRKASPKKATPKKATPKKATPKKTPKKSPGKATPRSGKKTSSVSKKSKAITRH